MTKRFQLYIWGFIGAYVGVLLLLGSSFSHDGNDINNFPWIGYLIALVIAFMTVSVLTLNDLIESRRK